MSFIAKTARRLFVNASRILVNNTVRSISHLVVQNENTEDMIARYECLFGRDDADGWDVRQAMNDLTGYDSVPEPRIIIAALHACRRLNDYALSVRFLEMVKDKCGQDVDKIYPYIVQEVGVTVAELGCDFPESLGYDKPELYMQSVFDM
ncbi:cytochrome c oxidase subunit 5A, mitochondrial [Leptinotarsa decemlineata]|uniref:cytochrome c oxidase subunit 5A, mitochondrial n=1 Tax=Leptinotarsa decemlineata TaxID=7539 RepID=UPI000C254779|nr:cytochrome c oxidase subunit 5A, mitochondrial-like [Leptinotarsa decemlineata]